MNDHVYKKIDVVGSSRESVDDAIRKAIVKASRSVHNLEWFEVDSIRGHIEDGEVGHFQVTMKLGFRLED
ncbi:MAG: dodecin family protein [Pseudomonadales bacterium]|nr:dodecin family protein [Pseudomonadales bacterium]